MKDKVQLIKKEIERLYNLYELVNDYQRMGACSTILSFIDSLPEEHNEDLEEDSSFEKLLQEVYVKYDKKISIESLLDIACHFTKWQKQQDEKLFKEDSWNYIEENYPNITEEEKLRLYDVSIKSRLAGANTVKQKMKEAGYVWDAEKKELKKIEQKSAWGEDDEEMIDEIIDYMKPMPIFFESTKGKSGKKYTKEFIKNAINWLKSIKPNHWKPSKEQMEALWNAIPNIPNSEKDIDTITELSSLYEELKNL